MSAETATLLKGKPLTQVLKDEKLLRLAAQGHPDLMEWFALTREEQLDVALEAFAPVLVTAASYSPKKGGRYQLAIATRGEGSATIMIAASDVDTTGLHAGEEQTSRGGTVRQHATSSRRS